MAHFNCWVVLGVLTFAAQSSHAAGRTATEQYQWYEQVAHLLAQPPTRAQGLEILQKRYPGVLKRIRQDRVVSEARWEYSWNYDEIVHAEIVDPAVLDALAIPHGQEAGRGTQSAGLMHSYGYLFSVLETAYGRKGKRWIESRIDERLGLKAGHISIAPPKGSFLGNLTQALDRLCQAAPHRLETVLLQKGVKTQETWKVATFLLPLRAVSGTQMPDTQLLVYGVRKSSKAKWAWVTAFPILEGFAESIRADRWGTQSQNDQELKDFTPRFNWNPRLKAGEVLKLQKAEFISFSHAEMKN